MKDKKIGNFMKVIKNNKVLLGYVLKFSPELFIWKLIATVMIIISDVSFNVLFVKYIIDSMGRNVDFGRVFIYIIGLGLIRLLCDGANACFSQYIEPVAKQKIHKGVHNLIYKKIVEVDLEKFDDTGFYNDYIWALNQIDGKTMNTFILTINFIRNIMNVVTYSVVSILYDKMILLFVFLPVLINIFVGIYRGKLNYKIVKELTPINRQKDYSRRSFYLQQYAKEIKTYGVGDILLENFNDCVDANIQKVKQYRKRFFATTLCENNSGWLFAKVICAAYMSYQVLISQAYSVGVFVVIFQAVGTFTISLNALFSVIPNFQENGLFAERILKIINYESKIETFDTGKNAPGVFHNLEIRNLSFQYPHSKDYALKNINLTMHKGDKIALVGTNGAGKTTLIKLVLRLYDPTAGSVFMNGEDVRDISTKDYRRKFSTIFQDYQIYAIKLIENIYMRRSKKEETKEAAEYLKESDLEGFEDQLWRNVTKEFDKEGIVLSGGQSQKVAIARAFAKNGDLVIMDEASSSLDPIAEYEINNTILNSLKDKSIIVISHRLSTIQHVDKIYFMEGGEIMEEGTHDELIAMNGKYAEMYTIQAEKYRMTEENYG